MLIDLQSKRHQAAGLQKPHAKKPLFAGKPLNAPVQNQSVAKAPISALKAYAAPQIKFGAAQGFNITDFIRNDADSALARTWEKAQERATGSSVTPEDWLLAVLDDFQSDLETFRATPSPETFFPQSYIGAALGMTRNVEFLSKYEGSSRERQVNGVTGNLKSELASQSASESGSSVQKLPSPELAQVFSATQQVLRKAEVVGAMNLASIDVVLQVMAKSQDKAGQLAKSLIQDLALKPTVDIRNYTDDEAVSSGPVGDTTEGLNLSELVRQDKFRPLPLSQADSDEVMKRLKQNRKNLILNIPKGIDADRAVEALAARTESALPESARPVFIRLDLEKFMLQIKGENNEVKVEDLTQKLREKIQSWVADHGRVVVHLKHPERLSQLPPAQSAKMFSQLDVNEKVQLLLTPDKKGGPEEAPPHPGQPPRPSLSDTADAGQFLTLAFEKPSVSELKQYLLPSLKEGMQKRYPEVILMEEALDQAILMASRTGDPIEETALDYLMAGAEHLLENASEPSDDYALMKDNVKQGVLEDPSFNYAAKSTRHGSYQTLDAEDLRELLAHSPTLIGMDDAQDFFKEWGDNLKNLSLMEKMGLKVKRTALVYGSEGTGKTDLILRFAQANNLPVVLLSGKTLAELQDPAKVVEAVQQAFANAKRQALKNKAPVLVLADNIESAWMELQQPNGMKVLANPLLAGMLSEQKRLKQEENKQVLSVTVTNDQQTLQVLAQKANVFDAAIPTTPPLYLSDRVQVFKGMAAAIEKQMGRKIFADDMTFSRAARNLSGVTPKQIRMLLERAAQQALTTSGFSESARVDDKMLGETIYEATMGKEKRRYGNLIQPEDRLLVARHEVLGHALSSGVMKRILKHTGPNIDKVTMIPQGGALGYVSFLNEDRETVLRSKKQLFSELVCTIASTPAEKIAAHDIGTGRGMDLKQATQLAMAMVNNYGMGKNRIIREKPEEHPEVVNEAQAMIETAEKIAQVISEGYQDFAEGVVGQLFGNASTPGVETMSGEEFMKQLDAYMAANPSVAKEVEQKVIALMVEGGIITEGYQKNGESYELTRPTLPPASTYLSNTESTAGGEN